MIRAVEWVAEQFQRLRKRSVQAKAEASAAIAWQDSWQEATLQAAYDALRGHHAAIQEGVSAVDTKAVTLFAISSAILSLVPTLHELARGSLGWWFGIAAGTAWVGAIVNGWLAFRPRSFRAYPNPDWLITSNRLSLEPNALRLQLLESLGESVKTDGDLLDIKAHALQRGLLFAALEVALLVLALLLS